MVSEESHFNNKGELEDSKPISEQTEKTESPSRMTWWNWFIGISAGIFVLYHVIYLSDVLLIFTDIVISPDLHLGIHLGSVLFFVFSLVRARKSQQTKLPPIYDVVLALIGLGICIYYGIFAEEWAYKSGTGIITYPIMGWILAVLLLEASRRTVGLIFTFIVAFFIIYPLISGYLPGVLHSPSETLSRWGEFMFLAEGGIFGFVLSISAKIVVVFVLFSQILIHTGAGEFFTNLAYSTMGTMRGGPAKMAVAASGLFGTLSGSAASNVAATGTFTIPLMKKLGYPAHYAGAVEAVASMGGILMPPIMGAVIFVLADFIEMPYILVVKHAVIPACLYYLALFIMVDQEAARLGMRGLPREELPSLWRAIKQGWWYAIPIIALIYLMAVPLYAPQKAVIYAMVILLIMSAFSKRTRMGPKKLMIASEETVRTLLMVAVAIACGGLVIGSVSLTGVGVNISRELVSFSGGNIAVLLGLTAAVSFIMGMGVGILGCYVFLALLIVPALTTAGVPEIAGHLFVFYWAMISFITPPVATLAYVAAAFANANPVKIGWQAARLGILAYVLPFAWVFKPALITIGTPLEIVAVVLTTAIGTVGLAFGVGGTFMGKLNWLQRLLCIAGSMLIIFGDSMVYIGGGVFILIVAILWQWLKKNNYKLGGGNSGAGKFRLSGQNDGS